MEHNEASHELPLDISIVTALLRDGTRSKVLKVLSEAGDGPSFKELVHRTELPPTTLAYHLKVLSGMSLVKKGLKERPGRRDHSSYSLTEQGSRTLKQIDSIKEPLRVKGASSEDYRQVLPIITVTYMSVGPRCITVPSLGA